MSSPACSWSPSTAETASTNCSRKWVSAMPVENGWPCRLFVYHVGRGHDPVTVVGSSRSFVAVNIVESSFRSGWSPCSASREDVEADGEDQDHAHRDLLVQRVEPEQHVAVADQGDEQDADDRPPHGAVPAEDARAADDDPGQHGE